MPKSMIVTATLLLATAVARAQDYDLSRHTIDGGGGTSSNGTFSLSGTIGQPDAGAALTSGTWSLTGGFIFELETSTVVPCTSLADCADPDGDGIRDDPCLWWECLAGVCVSLHRDAGQADMGGFAGSCPIDGACDINDGLVTGLKHL